MNSRLVAFVATSFLSADLCAGADLQNHLSLQGFTGIINTPSAEVTTASDVDLQFNNQLESQFVRKYPNERNFIFSLGILPHVELGGRLASRVDSSKSRGYIVGGERDLSGNIKLQLPWQPSYLPHLAVGVQDFGGGAPQFRSKYAVASETLGPLKLSLGYGTGPDRLSGVFGGAEWQALDWLYVLADNDSDESNFGLRLVTPRPVFGAATFSATAKLATTGTAKDFALGIELRIPLGNERRNTRPLLAPVDATDISTEPTAPLAPPLSSESLAGGANRGEAPLAAIPYSSDASTVMPASRVPQLNNITDEAMDSALRRIGDRLTALSFQFVQVGADGGGTLYVEYENLRYNHGFLDAMGLVLGTVTAMTPHGIERIEVLATKRDVPLLSIGVSVELYRAFLADPSATLAPLRADMRVARTLGFGDRNIYWLPQASDTRHTWFDFVLRPDAHTFVGTEFGAFDYSLALRTDARLNLWRGADLATTWDFPISHSDDVNPGRTFSDARHDSGLQDAFLQQILPLAPTIINMTSVGRQIADHQEYLGAWNETVWNPATGQHSFRLKLGYFEDEQGRERNMWTGYYDLFWAPLNSVFEVNYGQYWYGDRGFTFIARRFFGDTAVSAFVKYNGDKAGGLSVSFPLTPRQDPKPGIAQVRGANRWAYGMQTSIGLAKNSNPIDTRIAVDSNTYNNLLKDVLDAGRLNAPYIRENVLRLRDAYVEWGAK